MLISREGYPKVPMIILFQLQLIKLRSETITFKKRVYLLIEMISTLVWNNCCDHILEVLKKENRSGITGQEAELITSHNNTFTTRSGADCRGRTFSAFCNLCLINIFYQTQIFCRFGFIYTLVCLEWFIKSLL